MKIFRKFLYLNLILILFFCLIQNFKFENLFSNKFLNLAKYDKLNNKNLLDNKKYNKVEVKTDVFSLNINLKNGNIEDLYLLKYLKYKNSKKPLKLLKNNINELYKIESGLSIKNFKKNKIYPKYFTNKKKYFLKNNKNNLVVNLFYKNKKNIKYIKTFKFKRSSYKIDVKYNIINNSNENIKVSMFGKIKIKNNFKSDSFILNKTNYIGYSSDNNDYFKLDINNILNKKIDINTNKGWISMIQKYFTTAWIPHIKGNLKFITKTDNNNIITIGFKSKFFNIKNNDKKILSSSMWIGPKVQNLIQKVTNNFDLILNYGYLWFVIKPLFFLLNLINRIVNNWGFSIIILTLITKILTYPLTNLQYNNIVKINLLKPKIEEIKKKYKDDLNLNKKILLLYKKKNISPLGNFLPILIQMPIFLSMYYLLMNTIELRHAKFILWIDDLSSKDPYYILPILMFILSYFTQNIMFEEKNKYFRLFYSILNIFFIWFPSGLIIYYIFNNLFTSIQQYYVSKKYNND